MIPPELIAGGFSAAAGFLFKAHSMSVQSLRDIAELEIKRSMTADQLANMAAKRSSPFARKVIAFIVIGTVFGGLVYFAPMADVPVSIVTETDQKSLLWGLFKWGKGIAVTEANGFVLVPFVSYAVSMVLGFFLGTGSAKFAK